MASGPAVPRSDEFHKENIRGFLDPLKDVVISDQLRVRPVTKEKGVTLVDGKAVKPVLLSEFLQKCMELTNKMARALHKNPLARFDHTQEIATMKAKWVENLSPMQERKSDYCISEHAIISLSLLSVSDAQLDTATVNSRAVLASFSEPDFLDRKPRYRYTATTFLADPSSSASASAVGGGGGDEKSSKAHGISGGGTAVAASATTATELPFTSCVLIAELRSRVLNFHVKNDWMWSRALLMQSEDVSEEEIYREMLAGYTRTIGKADIELKKQRKEKSLQEGLASRDTDECFEDLRELTAFGQHLRPLTNAEVLRLCLVSIADEFVYLGSRTAWEIKHRKAQAAAPAAASSSSNPSLPRHLKTLIVFTSILQESFLVGETLAATIQAFSATSAGKMRPSLQVPDIGLANFNVGQSPRVGVNRDEKDVKSNSADRILELSAAESKYARPTSERVSPPCSPFAAQTVATAAGASPSATARQAVIPAFRESFVSFAATVQTALMDKFRQFAVVQTQAWFITGFMEYLMLLYSPAGMHRWYRRSDGPQGDRMKVQPKFDSVVSDMFPNRVSSDAYRACIGKMGSSTPNSVLSAFAEAAHATSASEMDSTASSSASEGGPAASAASDAKPVETEISLAGREVASIRFDDLFLYFFSYVFRAETGINLLERYTVINEALPSNLHRLIAKQTCPGIVGYYCPFILIYSKLIGVIDPKHGIMWTCRDKFEAGLFWLYLMYEHYGSKTEFELKQRICPFFLTCGLKQYVLKTASAPVQRPPVIPRQQQQQQPRAMGPPRVPPSPSSRAGSVIVPGNSGSNSRDIRLDPDQKYPSSRPINVPDVQSRRASSSPARPTAVILPSAATQQQRSSVPPRPDQMSAWEYEFRRRVGPSMPGTAAFANAMFGDPLRGRPPTFSYEPGAVNPWPPSASSVSVVPTTTPSVPASTVYPRPDHRPVSVANSNLDTKHSVGLPPTTSVAADENSGTPVADAAATFSDVPPSASAPRSPRSDSAASGSTARSGSSSLTQLSPNSKRERALLRRRRRERRQQLEDNAIVNRFSAAYSRN